MLSSRDIPQDGAAVGYRDGISGYPTLKRLKSTEDEQSCVLYGICGGAFQQQMLRILPMANDPRVQKPPSPSARSQPFTLAVRY